MSESGTIPAPPPAPPSPPPEKKQVVFDSQEAFEAALSQRVAQAVRAAQRELGVTKEEVEELQRLRQEKADRDRQAQEAKGNYEKALESVKNEYLGKEKSFQTTIGELTSEIEKDRIENALVAAAAEYGALKPAQIVRLLRDRVKLDKDTRQPMVMGEDGKPEYKNGRPLTVRELVEGYLTAEPHLRKPVEGQGSGSKGGGETSDENAGGDTSDLAKLKADYEAAQKTAATSPTVANISRAHAAKRRFEEARAKKAGGG